MAELRFSGVTKEFGGVRALRGLDLTVRDGELLAIVGPSGSGKTTALRIAAGLESPTEGRVEIAGRDITAEAPASRNVAMIFQGLALFPHMTVRENISFGLSARRVSRDEIDRRVADAATAAGCEGLLERRPDALSGGERQRAALARALARRPAIFLLDEPLSNLDAPVRAGMRTEIKRLHRETAATMLYVTHDQAEALSLGDRVAVLHEGSLQQIGTAEEIYRRPANRFVASFVGTPAMNLLHAELVDGTLRTGSLRLATPAGTPTDRPLEIGIRAGDVTIQRHRGDAAARVELVELTGENVLVHLSAGDASLVATARAESSPPIGSEVGIRIDAGAIHVFDAETGRSLVEPS